MKKNNSPQSSIGRWLNDEAHHKDEPILAPKKHDAKKTPKKPAKKGK